MELLLHCELLCLLSVYSLVVKNRIIVIAGAAWTLFIWIGVICMGKDMPTDFYRYADGISFITFFVVILRLRQYILSNHERLGW